MDEELATLKETVCAGGQEMYFIFPAVPLLLISDATGGDGDGDGRFVHSVSLARSLARTQTNNLLSIGMNDGQSSPS